MIQISVLPKNRLKLLNSLKVIALPKAKRRKLLDKVARRCIKESRQNQRKQVDPKGRKWESRADGRRRKMQTKLARFMSVLSNDGSEVTFGWRLASSARIAAKHHYGHRQNFTRAQFIKRLQREEK
ncbi:phage virion morphogenesis protein [Vibrio amylolyticus]|uniref:phage virion morphogenesis protein n=1 Tax=Vibrio amylolyticus TaxID=2847292 RepID=UPI0035529FB9